MADSVEQNGVGERKREKKQRARRNRKRPREEEQEINFTFSIHPLKLGNQILTPVNHVRVVEPYPYTYATFAKARWIGRSVLDVYCAEFGSYPRSYYESAIQQGRIRVSENQVDVNYKIKGHDVLSHTVHRHEPGVLVEDPSNLIKIVAETDELVVVDKPATLPVHPCGAYNQNSLVPIMEHNNFGKLSVIHRLDRLTSGLVLLAKNSSIANRWGNVLKERSDASLCQKVYLARVRGKFPLQSCNSQLKRIDGDTVRYGEYNIDRDDGKTEESVENKKARNALGWWLSNKSKTMDTDATIQQVFDSPYAIDDWLGDSSEGLLWFHLACPTRVANHKDGICEAGSFAELPSDLYAKSVKAAQTSFGVVRYDPETDSTILVCRPETGRTHQIRLHLEFLGHPIANDPNYGGKLFYGDHSGQLACTEASALLKNLNEAAAPACETGSVALISDTPATEQEMETLAKLKRQESEPLNDFIQRTCVWCARSGGNDAARTMLELVVRSRGIWLHALQYRMCDSTNEIRFRTEPPSWS